jgi:hypothetical protein
MKNNFEILARFLEKFGDEVEGREFAEMTPEVKTKLEQFARGTLPAAEQEELVERLSQNPGGVSHLAVSVKALRGDAGDK